MTTLWFFLLIINVITLILRFKYLEGTKHNNFWKVFACVMCIFSALMVVTTAMNESEDQQKIEVINQNENNNDDIIYVTEDEVL